ncbi:MAG: DUF4367 domain-containing protein [Eubacteriales bacterium]|nr:DUF4367 domain-containing protein [Eubacteriales bacterium]
MKLTDEMLEQLLSQQAEQAGEIWERSLPQELEQPHTFSKRFERRMHWLIWRRKHPAAAWMCKAAVVLLVCIGIGAGAVLLSDNGTSGSTLEQPADPFGSAALQPAPGEHTIQQMQPEQPTPPPQRDAGTSDSTPSKEDLPDDDDTDERPSDEQPGQSTDMPGEPGDSDDTPEPPDNTDPTPSEPPEEPGDGDDTQEPPITSGSTLQEPSYVPAGMAAVSRQESETELIIRYASGNGKTVVYTSRYSADPQLSGDGETVSVSGAAAAIFRSNGEENTLEWIDASACYMLAGNLSKDELLNMANSTKK